MPATTTPPPEAAATDAGEPEPTIRRPLPPTAGADALTRRWTKISAGLAVIPVPLLDFATTTGCTLKLLHALSGYYDVPFKPQLGRSAISALVGGAAAPLATSAAYSLARVIPLIGVPLAAVASPLLAGSLTYAIGRVFTAHFGAGGTFLDFDPERFRDYFQEQVEAGRTIIRDQRSAR